MDLHMKAINYLFSISLGSIFLLILYAKYEEKRIYTHKVNSFKNSKKLICKFKDIKVVVSQGNNYIFKDRYFIKDEVATDVKRCEVLLDE